MTEQNNEPGISIQHIAAALQIIDLAGERGAIKGEEMAAVGAVRNTFAQFLDYARKQQEANAPAEEAEAEAAEA